MRFLIKVKTDLQHVNASIADGTFGQRMQQILSDLKPEAAYFLEEDGQRTAILIVDIQKASDMVKVGEPFFHSMQAKVHYHPVMSAQDLKESDLSEVAKKWSGV